jgi:hypothetical protein
MNFKRYALREIHSKGLPLTLHMNAPCPVATVEGAIKRAAADLAKPVDVKFEIADDLVSFHVTPRDKTPHEERREILNSFQFPTYTEYARYTLSSAGEGEGVLVNHFNMTRRAAHAAIRYAAKPDKVQIKKVNHNVSMVTVL